MSGARWNVAVAGQDAVGVAGQFARRIGQVAELHVKQVVGGQVAEVFGLARADVEVERVEADAQVRAADFGDQRRGRLQVVAEGAVGLKLQRRPQAALAGFLGDLDERDLHALDRLLRERRRHVAGDDDRADAQLAAQVEPAA